MALLRGNLTFTNADESEEVIPADVAMAKAIAEKLAEHYPGHPFLVHVKSETGMGYIKHPMLSSKMGYRLRIADLKSDPNMREAVKGAGELLERWNIARGVYRHELIREAQRAFA